MTPGTPHLPQINRFWHMIGTLYTRFTGWKTEGDFPRINKCVLIFSPHTTNWDFPNAVGSIFALGYSPNWMGKQSLFWGPAGPFMRILGGIPVNRNGSFRMVDQIVEAIKNSERIILGIAPEGTRSHTTYWKSGFYHIAHSAGVPIVFATVNYPEKKFILNEGIMPSGDIQADMQLIKTFFEHYGVGKYPHQVGPIAVKPRPNTSQS